MPRPNFSQNKKEITFSQQEKEKAHQRYKDQTGNGLRATAQRGMKDREFYMS